MSKESDLSSTPQDSVEVCTHERRPGTTVCLRCRHAARAAARDRFNRLMLRGSAVAIVVATFIAAGAVGATAISRGKAENRAQASAASNAKQARAEPEPAPGPTVPDSIPNDAAPAPRLAAQPQPAGRPATIPHPPTSDRVQPPLVPVLPAGESPLPDGVTATRGDTQVVVSFDTPNTRTRRPEKFELFVRATLPLVYGPALREVLSKIPDGTIAGQGELLTELPARGVRIPLNGAWTIHLFPETRPGQDGPLVVRYRVSVVPTSE